MNVLTLLTKWFHQITELIFYSSQGLLEPAGVSQVHKHKTIFQQIHDPHFRKSQILTHQHALHTLCVVLKFEFENSQVTLGNLPTNLFVIILYVNRNGMDHEPTRFCKSVISQNCEKFRHFCLAKRNPIFCWAYHLWQTAVTRFLLTYDRSIQTFKC